MPTGFVAIPAARHRLYGERLCSAKKACQANHVRSTAYAFYLTAICSLWAMTEVGASDSSQSDKSQFNLFNPTPTELLRDMSTDRPDKTESPYTVDAGHFQFEVDAVSYTYDRHNPAKANERVETLGIAPINVKVGLLNNVDAQFVWEPYTSVRTRDGADGTLTKQRGFGDVTIRSKINLWGNDGGNTALALMPVLKLPTHQDHLGNDSVEGGLIVPLGVSLPRGWSMGLMTEVDIIRDEAGGGHHPEFVNTITFGHDIAGGLAGYVEFFSLHSTESGSDWISTVDFGFTYAINENIQLDCGLNIGVTRAADDFNPFIGISWRL